ncbi:MAG: N-acetylmuramoyl-L-alanine amidase [bacterium]
MGQYDIERIKPPSYLVVHHSVSPEGDVIRNWSDQQVSDWFNEIGRTRTYAGYSHSYHYDPRTGNETFSAVQIALWPNGDDLDIYTDSWRVIPLVDDWYGEICWHAGNWEMNKRSVGCETYGRYDDKPLPENAVWALAEWCRNNIDKENNGATIIMGHKQIYPTACPGDWMNKIDLLIDMINNPATYQGKYFTFEEKKQMIDQLKAQIINLQSLISTQNTNIATLNQKNQELINENEQFKIKIQDLTGQIGYGQQNKDLLQSLENYKNQLLIEQQRREQLEVLVKELQARIDKIGA